MSLYTLRLLHISDIHMRGVREKEPWRRREVLGTAWKKNLDQILQDGPVDLVCLTGDVANTGQPDEYDEAKVFVEELLEQLGLSNRRFFVVPGNHDIDRLEARRAWSALRRNLPDTDPQELSRWLAGGRLPSKRGLAKKHRDEIVLRQRAYHDWVAQKLGRMELLPRASAHGFLGYRVDLNDVSLPFPISVIGLDSSWLAGDDSDAEQLRLTEDQIMRLAADATGKPLPGLRLALVHHPLHSLADHADSQMRLAKHVDFLLRGHLHQEDTANELRPDSQLFQIAAGCLYEGGKGNTYANSCQVLTLTLNELGKLQRIDIHFRTWSPRGHWHDDPSRHANAPRGRLACIRHSTAQAEHWSFLAANESATAQSGGHPTSTSNTSGSIVGLESLLDGMRTLPAGPQVRKFLATYLGTRERPEAFGGRTKELQVLHDWLNAPSPPALVLAARAGSGKSALLCQFCVALLERTDVALAYFPISIRYQTSLENRCLPALVSRLCHLHGEQPPAIEHTSPEQWRLLLDQYLTRPLPDGRTLLLTLDGLDETTGWQFDRTLLPVQPTAGVRILVAARTRVGEVGYEGWRQTLGWASPTVSQGLSLVGLDVDGVAEAIASLGMPLDRVAQRSELVVQIHRLSRGEPLLVQLWCHRLWQAKDQALALTPEQLGKFPPGLKGYLQEFWESRKPEEKSALRERESAQLLLEIFASALGPLSRGDVLALVPEIRGVAALKDALEPLSRFVDGDGLAQGYVLRHSLLRDYFREEEMTPALCQERDDRFLSYGERTLTELKAGRLQPTEVSSYLLQHLGAHLRNADRDQGPSRAARQLTLVANPWRRAWERHENGIGGFLHDVEQAWTAAEAAEVQLLNDGQSPQYLTSVVRCAVCVAAQRTRSSNIYFRLFELLVEKGVWSSRQALAYVQQMTGEVGTRDSRKEGLKFLLPRLPDDLVRRALDIALELANGEWGNGDALFALSERVANVCPHEAIAAVYGVSRPYSRMLHMVALAKHLPGEQGASLYARALDLARSWTSPESCASALEQIAVYAPDGERESLLLEAATLALRIPELDQRAHHLRMLIPKLPRPHRLKALDALFDAALQVEKDADLFYAMEVLDSFHPATQRRILRRVWSDPKGPVVVLAWATRSIYVGGSLSVDQVHRRWRMLVSEIGLPASESLVRSQIASLVPLESGSAVGLLVQLAPVLRRELLQEMSEILRSAAPHWALTRGLCLFGHFISPAATMEGLQRSLRLPWPSEGAYSSELWVAFEHLSESDRSLALGMVAAAESVETKAWASFALARLVTGERRQALVQQAAAAALSMPSAKQRADLLLKVWPHVPEEQRTQCLNAGLEAVDSMRSRLQKVRRIQQLASMFAQPYCDSLLRIAVSEIASIERNYRRAAVYEDLLHTEGISAELKAEILVEALREVRSSKPIFSPDLTDLSRHAAPAAQKELLIEAFNASRTFRFRTPFLRTAFVLRPSLAHQQQFLQMSEQLETKEQIVLLMHYAWPNAEDTLKPAVLHRCLDVVRRLPEHDAGRLGYVVSCIDRVSSNEREALTTEAMAVAREFLEKHQPFLHQKRNEHDHDDDYDHDELEISRVLQSVLPGLLQRLPATTDVLALESLIPLHWHDSQAALLRFVNEPERSLRVASLLARLAELPEEKRATPLAMVAVRLDGEARTQAIAGALSLARAVPQGGGSCIDYRPEVLKAVAPCLELIHVDVFTGHIAASCRDGGYVANLSHVLGSLPDSLKATIVTQLTEGIQEWPAHMQEQFLVACAEYLPAALEERFVASLPRAAQPQHAASLKQVIHQLSDRVLQSTFAAVVTANGRNAPTDGQAVALSIVGAELLRRSPTHLAALWPSVLGVIRRSTENLSRLNTTLQHLAAVLRSAVGVDVIDEVVDMLLDLGDWWQES